MPSSNAFSLLRFLCVGCGTCIAVCPTSAISPMIESGYYSITIDREKCVNCYLCVKSCPILNYLSNSIPRTVTLKIPKAYLAWASDERIRYRGASGGVVTALLKYLLDKKAVDGVLVVRMKGVEPEVLITKNVDKVLSAQGSVYFATYGNKLLRHIAKEPGRYAIVGLPCQIDSIKYLIEKRILHENSIAFLFALRCHSVFAHWYLDYILSFLKLKRGVIRAISSRGFGWPGGIFILSDHGIFKIPLFCESSTRGDKNSRHYLCLWNPLSSSNLSAQFGCNVCINHSGVGADIAFGDAWISSVVKTDRKGTSLIQVYSEKGLTIIKESVAEGIIQVKEISNEAFAITPKASITQRAIKTYINYGLIEVLMRYGMKGIARVIPFVLFRNQHTRDMILKIPYKILAAVIEKRYLLGCISDAE